MNSIVHTAISEFVCSAAARNHGVRSGQHDAWFVLSGKSSNYGLLSVAVLPSLAHCRPFVVRIARRRDARHLHRERAVLAEVRSLLGPDLRVTIPEPLYLGEARGHPFLVGTFLAGEVLASTLSGPARLWKRALINPPASWLLALGKQTRRRISSDRLAHAVVTLERAARSRDLDDLVRRKASRAAHILQSYAPGIPCVVQHGDFHAENILTNGWNTITGIVDWVDAIIEGFPGVDLLQFAASVGLRDRTRDRMLDVYANGLGVSAQLCCALSVAHWLEVRLRLNGVFSHHELARSVRTIDQLLLTELRQLGGPSKES